MHPLLKRFTVLAAALGGMASPVWAVEVTRLVPVSAPFLVYARSIPDIREKWEHTPMAKTWAEPEVQKFFAPLVDEMAKDGPDSFTGSFEEAMGLGPTEFFGLFAGEAIVSVVDTAEHATGSGKKVPQVLVAAELGGNRARFEEALRRSIEKSAEKHEGERTVEEEFQGETLHITVRPSSDDASKTEEAEAWAIIDDTIIFGSIKSVLQNAIATLKSDDVARSIEGNPNFKSVLDREKGANAILYVGLDTLIPALVAQAEAPPAGEADGQKPRGGMLAQFGMTPGEFVRTLGLDSLTGFYSALEIGDDASTISSRLSWKQQTGILRLLAYGAPPPAQPSFVPENWSVVSTSRFSIRDMYGALRETLRDLGPMFDGMVQQRIRGINKSLGVDIERDLIGNIGDEILSGGLLPEPGSTGAGIRAERLLAFGISNPDSVRAVFTAFTASSPALTQMITKREFLGESISTFKMPGGANGVGSISWAITNSHLLIDVGGATALEGALQNANGAGSSLWKKPSVISALGKLPEGASGISYLDMKRVIVSGVDALALAPPSFPRPPKVKAGADADEDAAGNSGPQGMCDPSAKPSAAVLEKHWTTAEGAVYRDNDGLRILFRVDHGD